MNLRALPIADIFSRKFFSVSPDALLSEALNTMLKNGARCVLIIDRGKPLGIVTERDLVKIACKRVRITSPISDVMSAPIVSLPSEGSLHDAYAILRVNKIHHLAITDGTGIAVGILSQTDILDRLGLKLFDSLPLHAIMTKNLLARSPGDSLSDTLDLMARRSVSCVVVEKGVKPVGIITERDVARFLAQGMDFTKEKTGQWMSRPVGIMHSDTLLKDAVNEMRRGKFGQFLLASTKGRITGMVTHADIVRELMEGVYVKGLNEEISNQRTGMDRSEEKYRNFFETAPDIIFVMNVETGVVTDCNETATRLTGFSRDEIIGYSCFERFHPDCREQVKKHCYPRFLETGEIRNAEFQMRTKQGGRIDILMNVTGAYDEQGRLLSGTSVCRDVTERKKAQLTLRHNLEVEQALEKSSRLFFAREGPDLNAFLGYLGKTVKANRAYIFRLRQNGSRLDNTHEWCHANAKPLIHHLQNVNASSRAWLLEKLRRGENIVINDANELPAEASAQKRILLDQKIAALLAVPVMGQNKELFGFMGFDDTEKKRMWSDADLRILRIAAEILASYCERRRTEREVRQSEEKFRSVAQTAIAAIISADSEGNIITWNEGAGAIFGYEEAEALGRPLTILMPDQFKGRHRHGFQRFMETGEARIIGKAIELQGLRKNGEKFPLELSISSWKISEKRFCGALLRDITAQVHTNKALAESHEEFRTALEGTIQVICRMVEARDPYTAGHEQRVATLACAIALESGLDAATVEGIRIGAAVHDIGKIQLPAEILNKPARLTPDEFSLVKRHTSQGHAVLSGLAFPWPLGDIALQHHERMDGSGYPRGLKGHAICLEARIIAVADVVEAIVSHRPYRPALSIDTAMEEISTHRGDGFDPGTVDACLRLFQDKGFTLDQPTGSR